MNKAEFLQRLRQKLSVLDDRELEDILNEYEQHIDMKAAGAMTEEEAIADFGDMDELAAQILEAYHVRADFAENEKKAARDGQNEDALQRVYVKVKRALTGGWKEFVSALKCGGRFLEEKGDACADAIFRFLKGKKEVHAASSEEEVSGVQQESGQAAEEACGVKARGTEAAEEKSVFLFFGRIVSGCGHAAGSCVSFCWKAAVRCVKLCWALAVWCVKYGWKAAVWAAKICWNLFWVCSGIVIGLFSCMCLFGLGLLAVMLVLGYPLAGITIGMLGLTLCMCSVTIGCFTLLLRGKKKDALSCAGEKKNAALSCTGEEKNAALSCAEGESAQTKEKAAKEKTAKEGEVVHA